MSFCCECPKCGYTVVQCEIPGCKEDALYEGWHSRRDFHGVMTGLNVRLRVCEEHKTVLRGGSDES